MPKKAVFKVVVKGGAGSSLAVVRPPFDNAEAPPNGGGGSIADAVTIKNKTDARIWVKVPAKIFDLNNNGAADGTGKVVEIAAQSDGLFRLPDDAQRGVFSFQVFCEETFSFAQGNSDPEFIIEN